jgi:DNA polymerase-3 subunit delta'
MVSLFTGLLGQDMALGLLAQAINHQRLAPAYLFFGPPGVGKAAAARQFAAQLLSSAQPVAGRSDPNLGGNPSLHRRIQQRNHPDLLWVEPTYLHQGRPVTVVEAAELGVRRKSPPQIRLEQVRDITRFLMRPPLESPRAMVVVEGAETMAEAAANGLLKTLEEPGQATVILLAPSPSALLPTLVSRCQCIPFQRLSMALMATILTEQGHDDIFNHPVILALAQGSPGQAIAVWQQWQSLPPDLLNAVSATPQTLKSALTLAQQITKALDLEAQLWLVDYLQQLYWQQQTQAITVQALEQARFHLRRFVQPRLVWEVTLMAMVPN